MKAAVPFASLLFMLSAGTALAAPTPLSDAQLNQVVAGEDFTIVAEIADLAAVGAPTTDPLLVNPWGLSAAPGGPLWVANQGTSTSTVYNNTSYAKLPLTVAIPSVGDEEVGPTGTVFTSFNRPGSFQVSANGKTGHSLFLFDTLDGTISGWAPSVDPANAIIAVDLSSEEAAFTGLTLQSVGSAPKLYAADFANNRVDVFNGNFHMTDSFTDSSLPPGYSPFNVQTIGNLVYVAYAKKEADEPEEIAGPGLGYIVVFDARGHKMRTLVAGGALNAPWGMTIAPASFGDFAGALLVGNFGDGKVNAYNPTTGEFLGTIGSDASGPIVIDGLWALRPGPDGSVVFSAGVNDETHGLVGEIRPAFATASWAYQAHVTLRH